MQAKQPIANVGASVDLNRSLPDGGSQNGAFVSPREINFSDTTLGYEGVKSLATNIRIELESGTHERLLLGPVFEAHGNPGLNILTTVLVGRATAKAAREPEQFVRDVEKVSDAMQLKSQLITDHSCLSGQEFQVEFQGKAGSFQEAVRMAEAAFGQRIGGRPPGTHVFRNRPGVEIFFRWTENMEFSTAPGLPQIALPTAFVFEVRRASAGVDSTVDFDKAKAAAPVQLLKTWELGDLKTYTQMFVALQFGVDLEQHPVIWEQLYDLFKRGKEAGTNVGTLIINHLLERREIVDMPTMSLMKSAYAIFKELGCDSGLSRDEPGRDLH